MQPRQLARVRPLGKFYCVAKLIVGPKTPVSDWRTVTYFPGAPALTYGDRASLRISGKRFKQCHLYMN
jgi:hypothetical protein